MKLHGCTSPLWPASAILVASVTRQVPMSACVPPMPLKTLKIKSSFFICFLRKRSFGYFHEQIERDYSPRFIECVGASFVALILGLVSLFLFAGYSFINSHGLTICKDLELLEIVKDGTKCLDGMNIVRRTVANGDDLAFATEQVFFPSVPRKTNLFFAMEYE